MQDKFDDFEQFWLHYVQSHTNKTNRWLHVAGVTAAVGCAAVGIVKRRPLLVLAAPVVGYAMAYAGHFLVEGNTPCTLSHPVYELRAALRMTRMMLEGTMDQEVRATTPPRAEPAAAEASAQAKVVSSSLN